ncbi:MAG: ATP-binding protein [Actinomycetota bacterium]
MGRISSKWANLPLRRKGLVVVSLPVAALVTATLFGYLVQTEADERKRASDEAVRARNQIQTVLNLLLDAETGVRGYDLSKDRSFLDPYEAAFEELPAALATLERIVGDNTSQVVRAADIRFLAGRKLEVLAELRSAATQPGALRQHILERDDRLMQRLRTELGAMLDEEENLLSERLDQVDDSQRDLRIVFAGSIALGLTGGVIAMLLFTTGISHRVQRISDSARRLAQGAPLPARPAGRDEVGQAAEALGQASTLLADREQSLREAKEMAERAKDAAERANWAKSDFLSKTSHELRTPLTAMIGFSHYMENQDLAAEHIEIMQRIRQAGDHLGDVLQDVLDIARVEAGNLSISMQPVGVEGAVREAVAMVAQVAAEHDSEVEITLGECATATVLADPRRLNQVLINLISNAIKYNSPGGRVAVGCFRKGSELHLSVSDEGPGIPREKLSQLFEPYNRLGAEATPVKGLGLGLTISRSLVELMKGRLEVTSVVDQGSIFTVALPVAAPHGGLIVAEDESSQLGLSSD